MDPTSASLRILQIHPSRRCNLRCLHCYSSSSPDEREELDCALLGQALIDAGAEGYGVASFSGGEPLLYRSLPEVLDRSHEAGLITTVTSNGMLLDERRLDMLRGRLDLLAISLDGVPASHDRMRGSARAFAAMTSHLRGVRKSGIPFGFIFTLRQSNLHELDWVARFALEAEARLLQIHPLETAGRAIEQLPGQRPDEIEAAFAYLEAARIQNMVGDRLVIQLDLLNRDLLRQDPGFVVAEGEGNDDVAQRLANLVSPLVIEADGTVVPLEYGFAREYALGNLHATRLSQLATSWRRQGYRAFRTLCRRVFAEETVPHEFPFVNWYETVTSAATVATATTPATCMPG